MITEVMAVLFIQYISMAWAYSPKAMIAYECIYVPVTECLQHGWHYQSIAYVFDAKILCTSGRVY